MQASDIAAPAQHAPEPAAAEGPSDLRLQRILKFVVVALAVVLFAGVLAVVARVIYLASSPAAQPATPSPTLAIRPEQSIELPPGAQVRSVSLSGNRLAVYYDAEGVGGIAVLDLQTGRMITNVAIEAKPPGR